MILSRFKLLLFALLGLSLLTASAQQIRRPTLGNEALAKQRVARFLAERGISSARGSVRLYSRSPAEMLAQARAQFRRPASMNTSSSSQVPVWQPVGPNQVFTNNYGNVAGRVTSIAVDPSDSSGNTVYVGTAFGGVWKSTNAADSDPTKVTFVPITDSVYSTLSQAVSTTSLSIGAVSVQPVPAGANPVILSGTGLANDTSASYFGSGILRSTDGGNHWSVISETSDLSDGALTNFNLSGNGFAGFAWGTVSGNPVVVAAVSQAQQGVEFGVESVAQRSILGIYYSTDLGQTWYMASISDCTSGSTCSNPSSERVQSRMTDFTPCDSKTARLPCGNAVTSIVWNPIRDEFFAAVRSHGYYVSSDGQNWYRLESQPGANLSALQCPPNNGYSGSQACLIYNGVLAVQPVTGDTFALTTAYNTQGTTNNQDEGLWQDACGAPSGLGSCTSSDSFQQINDPGLDALNSSLPIIPQADYDLYLAAVPFQNGSSRGTLLFAGTADIYRCALDSVQGCVWRNTTNALQCMSARVAPAQFTIDATFGANGLLYFGNDGGIWRSTDAVDQTQSQCSSDDASHFQNLNSGFTGSIALVDDLAPDAANPQTMMVSLGTLGTAAPLSGTGSWEQVLDGEGDYAAIDPSNPQNWYATSEFGIGINLCTDGASCNIAGFGSPVIDSADVGNDGYGQVIPAPWLLDPQNTSNLIVGTCRVWWGAASGGSLAPISGTLDNDNGPNCSGNAEIRALAASGGASGTPERIYAGMAGLYDGGATEAGQVFEQSVTDGASSSSQWINLSNNINNFNPNGYDISSIYVDPHSSDGQTVYVTVQGFGTIQAYQTSDGGNTWQNISSDLPDSPANSIVVDPNDANTVYVATDAGVYYTRNVSSCAQVSSNCWSPFGASLPNAPVTQLTSINTSRGPALLAGTYGRGVWQIDLPDVADTTATAAPSSLTFSNQAIGTTSSPQPILVTNDGSIALQVSSISTAGDFTESDTCSGQAINPGSACIIEVSFAPTKTGSDAGTLTIYANLSRGQLTASLNGVGVQGAAVTLNPSALCFQETLVDQTTSTSCQAAAGPSQSGSGPIQPGQSIVIANTGGTPATLSSVSITSGISDFKIIANTCGPSLTAANSQGDSCTVSVTFTPIASGNRTGVLTVSDSLGTQTAQLVGTGQSQATDTLSPSGLTFGSEPIGTTAGAAQQLTVTMTNTGDQGVQDIALQSSTPQFSASNNCGTTLAGHASCAIIVSFLPTSLGAQSGMLSVSDSIVEGSTAVSHTQQVTLSGTGTAPAAKAFTSPSTVNFGYYQVGGIDPNFYIISIENNGASTITGLQSTITGDFSIQAASQNPCGTTLAIGATCNVAVAFVPKQANQRTGSLSITGTNLSPLTVALTGDGAAFQMSTPATALISGGRTSTTIPVTITSINGSTGAVNLACSVVPSNATCSVSLDSVTLTGSSTQSATVAFTVSPQSRLTTFKWKRAALALCMLLPMGFIGRRSRKWRVTLICILAVLILPIGCGVSSSSGSDSSQSGGSGGGTGSSAGTYNVTITGIMLANTQSGTTAPGLTIPVATQVTVE